MIGKSGCFGINHKASPVGDQSGAETLVDDIVDGIATDTAATTLSAETYESIATAQVMVQVAQEYVRRVRVLTYAVIAIAIIVIMREIKD